ncbi:MAG: polysulfide reductase NrfD [Acetobacteraceae bacterium]|nr:polysulfide reductase NrfD [Acetobacteraceae bacterium]
MSDDVVLGHPTPAAVTDRICGIVLHERVGLWWWIALAASSALLGLGVVSVGWLFWKGVGVWGIDWPVVWGFAIINYVWWIAIASGGTFISALFFLVRVDWRTSINRIAETMMLCAAASAGIYPILHLGRPWFFYWLFPYPNTMTLWPQFRSPLLWDFMALLTYVVASVLFWYFGLLPDLAAMRDRARGRGAQMFYGVLAFGFRGTGGQWRHYKAAYGIMAALMAPLVVSVHSVVGLDFAGGETTGWHSTQFPPFFVFGALLSGFATVILLVIPMRHYFSLQTYITERHFDALGKLMVVSSLCMAYAYIMDVFTTFYGPDPADKTMFVARMFGRYAFVYWSTILFNVLLPQLLWVRRLRLNQPVLILVCLGAIVGMWFERVEIVVTSLHRTTLPSAWGDYWPTFWDWALMAGTIGLFLTMFLLLIRIVPTMSIAEMRELVRKREA